jgi:diguanylate cyclase (GGDEF)-like protein
VHFDLARPTERQLRDGVTCGLIAESIILPVLVLVTLVDHHPVRWGYVFAAAGCILASVVYLAFFMALTNGKTSTSTRATVWLVVVCLALTGLAFMELAATTDFALYMPAMLVGVVFVCTVGDRRMQIAVDLYAIGLIAVISWVEGLRGADFAVGVSVYASTIAVITLILARTVGSLTENVHFIQSAGDLNESLDDVDLGSVTSGHDSFQEIFARGLPLVGNVLPASRIAVFGRNAALGRFALVASWPPDGRDVADLGRLPQLTEALVTNSVSLDPTHCVVPVGYAADGELVMVVERSPADSRTDQHAEDTARFLASSFLRVTSRANFINGLHTESRTDPLTGLANRRSLFERIEIEMAHALRSDTPLSVAMIDLDHFKDFNDRYGHVAGDTVLRSIAAVMVSNIRGQDMVARFGGEEFCLVMPETDLLGAHHLLDKLRSGGRDASADFGVTLSAGLTSWDGIEDVASFIERADQALYRAKETGRDRVVSIQAVTDF